jgi:hypothetical protein
VELYARVRRAVLVEGRSERGVAREYGWARETVRKMLRHSIPPGYRRKQVTETAHRAMLTAKKWRSRCQKNIPEGNFSWGGEQRHGGISQAGS